MQEKGGGAAGTSVRPRSRSLRGCTVQHNDYITLNIMYIKNSDKNIEDLKKVKMRSKWWMGWHL